MITFTSHFSTVKLERLESSIVLDSFNCQLDTAKRHLRRESQLRDWPVGMSVGDWCRRA